MRLDVNEWEWTREPADYFVSAHKIEIVTKPHTDLWQRTYYHFRNDNAPVFQMQTEEKFFSFTVKATFSYRGRFDQCGIALYLDSENWLKASVERKRSRSAIWAAWSRTTAIPTGPRRRFPRLSMPCGTASADGRMTIAWNARRTA